MESIRVKPKMLTIEVNDDGEKINFPVDENLLEGLTSLVEHIEKTKKGAPPLSGDGASLRAVSDYMKKTAADIADKIDELFGPDTCRKVFCGEIPTLQMETDFFEQITPSVKKFLNASNARISRHTEKNV